MTSLTKPSFWSAYRGLPEQVRTHARKQYALFRIDPWLAGLYFKPIRGNSHVWSVRIGLGHRALGWRDGETITWFWIGTHEGYDRILKTMV